MFGLSIANALDGDTPPSHEVTAVVAWGDSLTAMGYPALAEALFDDGRVVLNRGVGGQTSTQIAARQGAVPITVSLAGDEIPFAGGAVDIEYDFDDGLVPPTFGSFQANTTTYNVANGALHAAFVNPPGVNGFGGPYFNIGTLTVDKNVHVEFDVVSMTNLPSLQVGFLAGAWSEGAPQLSVSGPGHYAFDLKVTNDNHGSDISLGMLFTGTDARAAEVAIDNIVIIKDSTPASPIAVTARSVSPVTFQGPFDPFGRRRIEGSVAGVSGYLERISSADDSGNDTAALTFTRTAYGAAVPCPPLSRFVPADATRLRDDTAWIWSGRNNSGDPQTIKADIAAMVQRLGHQRYLIGSILVAEGETVGTSAYDTITATNAGAMVGNG